MSQKKKEKHKKLELELVKMLGGQPLEPGVAIKVEQFEDLFGLQRNTKPFGMRLSEFKFSLFEDGLCISGDGLESTGYYLIVTVEEHFQIFRNVLNSAAHLIARYLVLMRNTPTEKMSELNRIRHQNMTREGQMRLEAFLRFKEVQNMLEKKPNRIVDAEGSEVA